MISIFAKRALNHQPLQIFGDGSQARDFIYVSDVIDATIAGLERSPQSRVFNIASGKETAILELAKTMQKIIQAQSVLKFYKARNELGFIARTSIDDALSVTTQWFKRTMRPTHSK